MWCGARAWLVGCVVALFLCVGPEAYALPSAPVRVEIAPAPGWVLPAADVAFTGGQPTAGLVARVFDLQTRHVAGQRWHFVRVSYEITGEVGIRELGQRKFEFVPPHQRLVFHRFEVRRGEEVRSEVKPGFADVLQRETNLESRVYSGARTAVVLVSDLRVGDVVTYEYSLIGQNPVLGGHVMESWQQGVPFSVARLSYRLLSDKPLDIRRFKAAPPETLHDGNLYEYSWHADNAPPVQIEDGLPANYSPLPWLQFSDFTSWAEVASWGQKLFVPPPSSPLLERAARDIASVSADPEARVLAALRKVQDEIRYFSLALAQSTHRPAPPETVLERRFGDCKDKSLLLTSLLRAMGLEADVALVSTWRGRQLAELAPSIEAFDHAIVAVVVAGERVFIDPAALHQRGSLQQRVARGHDYALLLKPGQDHLSEVPAPVRGEPELQSNLAFRVDRYGGATTLEVVTTYAGAYAEWLRSARASLQDAELSRQLSEVILSVYPRARLESGPLVDDDEASNRLVVKLSFALDDAWSTAKGEPPALDLFPPYLRGRFPSISPQRVHPFALEHPVRTHHRFEIDVPDDLTSSSVRDAIETTPYKLSWARSEAAKTLTLEFDYESKSDRVETADFAAFREANQRVQRELGVTLTGPGTPTKPSRVPSVVAMVVGFAWLCLLAAAIVMIQRKKPYWLRPAVAYEPTLRGIGGWLILLAIGVTLAPFRIFLEFVQDLHAYAPATLDAAFQTNPTLGAVLLFELCVNLYLTTGAAYACYLFWDRKRSFPIVFIVFNVSGVVLQVIDHLLASGLPNDAPPKPDEVTAMMTTLVTTLLWCVYVASSRRVKTTFLPTPSEDARPRRRKRPVRDDEGDEDDEQSAA